MTRSYGTRVRWWRVSWMFARAEYSDIVAPRRVMGRNWRRVHRGTLKRLPR